MVEHVADFEQQLSEALAAGAEGAPSGLGLAADARRRRRTRNRTRLAGLAAAAVLVAVAVPLGLQSLGTDDDGPEIAVDRGGTIGRTSDGWQIVGYDGIEVDLPPDWVGLDTSDCEFSAVRYGLPGTDPCEPDTGLAFYGSATFDPAHRSGLRRVPPSEEVPEGGWTGYVYGGDHAVYLTASDRDEAWRVLASVRQVTEPAPDLAAGSVVVSHGGHDLEIPATWVRTGPTTWCERPVERSSSPCSPDRGMLRFHDGAPPREVYGDVLPDDSGTWSGAATLSPEAYVEVTTPTQALGDLVLASAHDGRIAPADPGLPLAATLRHDAREGGGEVAQAVVGTIEAEDVAQLRDRGLSHRGPGLGGRQGGRRAAVGGQQGQ